MKLNSVVVVSLHSPKEKVWGLLLDLNATGVTVAGLDLSTFNDWLSKVGTEDDTGLATVFYPLYRVERIALDEPVGKIPSLALNFYQKTRLTLEEYLNKS